MLRCLIDKTRRRVVRIAREEEVNRGKRGGATQGRGERVTRINKGVGDRHKRKEITSSQGRTGRRRDTRKGGGREKTERKEGTKDRKRREDRTGQ